MPKDVKCPNCERIVKRLCANCWRCSKCCDCDKKGKKWINSEIEKDKKK